MLEINIIEAADFTKAILKLTEAVTKSAEAIIQVQKQNCVTQSVPTASPTSSEPNDGPALAPVQTAPTQMEAPAAFVAAQAGVPWEEAVSAPAQTETPTAPVVTQTTAPVATQIEQITVDAISRAGAALIDMGKMTQVIAVLQKYGVTTIMQLNPAQYPSVAADLRALGADI